MKYSFCYTLRKVVKKDESAPADENKFLFQVKGGEFMLMQCGPWRNTKAEVKTDEELYNNDPDAFLEMVKKYHGA